MIFGPQMYEFYLERYSTLYFLVGKLEFLLRAKVVTTLSNFAKKNGYGEWYEVIPDTSRNREAMARARIESAGVNVEAFLPFSFWRHLFRREYFAGLWVPSLHLVFVGLPYPTTKANFKVVCRKMKRANNIRNRVAHFNLTHAGNHEEELATLNWLINAMEGTDA